MIAVPPRALLLDFDGTLVDSVPALHGVYERFLVARGAEPSETEFTALNGPPLPEIVRRLAATHGFAEDVSALEAEYRAAVAAAYRDETSAFPGARRLLLTARRHGLRVAVVTSCPEPLARAALERLELADLLWAIVDSSRVPAGKPAGDIYRLALAVCEVDALDALAVEDSPHGLTAARAAGVPVLDAATGLEAIAEALSRACAARSFVLWPGAIPHVRRVAGIADLPLTAEGEGRCVAVFEAATRDRGHALFDGPVDFLRGWTPAGLTLTRGAYRHYLAARAEPVLAELLGPVVAVSGLIERGGHVLLGRRDAAVTQYPDHWELVPAGGLGGAPEDASTPPDVDWRAALLAELAEEAGLDGEVGAPLGLVFDTRDPVVDLCAFLHPRPPDASPSLSAEYPALSWHPLSAPPDALVPTSEALLQHAAAPGWLRPARPEDQAFVLSLRNRPENVAVSNRPRALAPSELPATTDPHIRIWILETGTGRAGHLTAHLETAEAGRTAWLGLALSPEFQGRGLGPFLLAEAGRRLAAEGVTTLAAHIIVGNAASRKAFTRAGFTCVGAAPMRDGRVRETWERGV